jgi:hypothetical protein
MQISIEQDELELAVRDYVQKMGISRSIGEIDFTATRGTGSGIRTTIEVGGITNSEATVTSLASVGNEVDEAPEADSTAETASEEQEEETTTESLFGS